MANKKTKYLQVLGKLLAFNGGEVDKEGYLRFTQNGEPLPEDEIKPIYIGTPGSGGGGGSTNNASLKVSNTTGWLYSAIAANRPCALKLAWSSIEDGISTGKGTLQVYVADLLKSTSSVDQGDVEIDVAKWLVSGTNTVKLAITDAYGNSRQLNFTIEVIALSVNSTFDGKPAFSGAINYYYVPLGAAEKTTYFLLDGEQIGHATTSLSGQQQDFIIPAQSHGSHTFEVYMEAVVEGTTIESNHLYYDLICTEDGNTTPIIASTYRPVETEQYDTFTIPYRVYIPAKLTSDIILAEDGVAVQELTVDRTEHQWSHRCDETGDNILTITCGDTVKTFTIPVVKSTVSVAPVTNNLVLDLDAYGRSNQEADPLSWESNGVSVEFSGFNKSSDCWQLDEDGITVMRVAGDARLTIPLKLFEYDFKTTGKTIELEFATRDVRNYDATLISCMDGGRGLSITSQQALAASAKSSIGTQYKEEEHIRLSFVVEKRTGTKMMLCYLNGICSGAVAYPDDDDFYQLNPVEVSIGSSECTIDLYHIRVYDNDLTRYQVLNNWIADTQVGALKKARWARNDVYDAYGNIVIEKLPKDLPYLVLTAGSLPQSKGDKKKVSGYYVDPVHPERSFRFTDAEIDVQGTSSQYYRVKNYKIKFKNGFIMADGTAVSVYGMNDEAIPVMVFCMKADVASSEGANNVVAAKIFNTLSPKMPAQEENERVRNTIDGHPIVIFWDSGSGPVFLGKYNFNNDKSTHEVFGLEPGDESWECKQNGTRRTAMKDADFSGTDWEQDFEARYPEDSKDITRLAEFVSWVASTNSEEATGSVLTAPVTYGSTEYTHDTAEYRLDKFRYEIARWAHREQSEAYYLFTLIILGIDQREKNTFPTRIAKTGLWYWLGYDWDSILGINNKGALAFSPFLEDTDYTDAGDPVFNGAAHVFWTNLWRCFAPEIEAMYQRWRVDGLLSFEIMRDAFNEHQSKWPEAIFNEDMYKKCLEAWIEDKDGQYLPMLLGKKELQRAWWLFFRFRYMDSKFVTGTSMTNRIMIRAHEKADISLRSYVPIYGNVFYNSLRVQKRMLDTTQDYVFPWDASGAEDAVIGINDADLLTSLGDLSGLMVETIDLSKATHLTHLYLGSTAEGYENKNLLSLTLGNNTLLKYIGVQNCTSLTAPVDASGCTNVEEIYFDNTAITGISLPDGGVLKKLHLPGTVTSLIVKNQPAISEFVIPGYSNITKLNLENAGLLDTLALDILRDMAPKSLVRLLGISFIADSYQEIAEFITRLDAMRGIDESGANVDNAQVSGTIYLEEVTQGQLNEIAVWQSRYPSLTVMYSRVKTYTVRFWVDGVLCQENTGVKWGENIVYAGETPTRENADETEDWSFVNWDPLPENVTSDMDCYAVFKNNVSMARLLIQRTIKGDYVNDRVTRVGTYAFDGCTKLKSVYMPEVLSVENFGLESCTALESVNLPKVTVLQGWVFYNCINLREVHFPSLTAISPGPYNQIRFTFNNTRSLRKVDLPVVEDIGSASFPGTVETVIIRRSDKVCTLRDSDAFSSPTNIYVPRALVDSYKVATNWSTHADRIRAIEDYPEICGGEE